MENEILGKLNHIFNIGLGEFFAQSLSTNQGMCILILAQHGIRMRRKYPTDLSEEGMDPNRKTLQSIIQERRKAGKV